MVGAAARSLDVPALGEALMTKFNEFDVAEFRRRAADMRSKAGTASDLDVKRECLMVAEAWDQFVAEVLDLDMAPHATGHRDR